MVAGSYSPFCVAQLPLYPYVQNLSYSPLALLGSISGLSTEPQVVLTQQANDDAGGKELRRGQSPTADAKSNGTEL